MPLHIRKYRVMKHIAKFLSCTLLLLATTACGKVRPVTEVPEIHVGEPTFFPTIVAHTDAPIIGGNRIDILLNGDEVFPAMLRDIKSARQTITFAQYLYQDGKLAREFAEALAERCRAGVKGHILLDSQGARSLPDAITSTMRDAGCKVEFFRRVEVPQVVFIWRLLRYNYRNHRRSLVIAGKVGSPSVGAIGACASRACSSMIFRRRSQAAGARQLERCWAARVTSRRSSRAARSRRRSSKARLSAAAFKITCCFCFRSCRQSNRS